MQACNCCSSHLSGDPQTLTYLSNLPEPASGVRLRFPCYHVDAHEGSVAPFVGMQRLQEATKQRGLHTVVDDVVEFLTNAVATG